MSGSITSLVGASYNIYDYGNGIYKVVHFPNPRNMTVYTSDDVDRSRKGNERKLDAAISRARRVILEKALCNEWEWFGTFTLDKNKYDRNDLDKFRKDFTQFIRDERKRTKKEIKYLLIPEMHQDGAWHMHGLLSGLSDLKPFSELRYLGWTVPDKLVRSNYSCWLRYHKKFGYVSVGAIRNPVACGFYITKYVGKDFQNSGVPVNSHLYLSSQGLATSQFHGDVYGECEPLNRICQNKYQFCETGFTHLDDCLDWTFAYEVMDFSDISKFGPTDYGMEPAFEPFEFDDVSDLYYQPVMEGFN